jgi:hypothetical protein
MYHWKIALFCLVIAYTILAIGSTLLLLKASCKRISFNKTQVVLFLVFLCSILRTATFASLINETADASPEGTPLTRGN